MNSFEKIAKILLDIKAVSLNAENPYHWVSGIIAPIYTDCRLIMGFPEERGIVIQEMEKVIKEKVSDNNSDNNIDVIAGVATSGIPYASWLAGKMNKPLIYIRNAKKDHGKENLIEGGLEKSKRVILIEDLVSTGGSSIRSIDAIREAGGIINNQVSIFTYELDKSKQNFKKSGIKAYPLTNFSTLVKVAAETGYLKPEEKELVLAWKDDPDNWGR